MTAPESLVDEASQVLAPVVERDILDQPAEAWAVRTLFSDGLIDDAGRRVALRWLLGPVAWWEWFEKAVMFLGLLLIRAGVVCFIAWNWADMSPLLKLGLIQLAIVGACAFALYKGLDSLIGKIAQTAAAALVGGFLAVFGQVYQTGADNYQLFVGWALLILPWVMIARFDGLWVLWLALVDVAVALYWSQIRPNNGPNFEFLLMILAGLNGTAAGVRERLQLKGWPWLQSSWVRWLLVPATLAPLIVHPILLIVGPKEPDPTSMVGTLFALVTWAVMFGFYRYRAQDVFVLTCLALWALIVLNVVVGRVLFDAVPDEGAFFLVGSSVVVSVGLAVLYLRKRAQAFRETRTPTGAATLVAPEETAARPLRELITCLVDQQHLLPTNLSAACSALRAHSESHSPWFIQTLIGFGAWMACLCFIACAGILQIFEQPFAAIACGGVMCFITVTVLRSLADHFWRQLALAMGFTGYILILIGASHGMREQTIFVLAVTSSVLSTVLYGFARHDVFRWSLGLAPQVLWIIYCLEGRDRADGIHALVLLQTIGVGAIFAWQPRRALWPLGYSFVMGLFGALVIPMLDPQRVVAWPSSIIQTAAEIWLTIWLLASGKQKNWRLMAGIIAAAGIMGALSVPGVLAAIGIVVLGHLERDPILRLLGIAFLPIYLFAFYYNLDTSLLFKAGTLIASGSALWASRFWIARQHRLALAAENVVPEIAI